jgi:cobalt-zinc-cadmium efflux system membrane fusion protein
VEGKTIVFVQHAAGEFEPQTVKIGRKDPQNVEILQGLSLGQTYVSENAFALKAQLQKGEFDSGHHH